MRIEPQDIFMGLVFEKGIAQCVNIGQFDLVVRCTDDCTCHHLTIPQNIEISEGTQEYKTNIGI